MPEKIRHGIDIAAPDLQQRRKHWNKAADKKFALPTETWREVIARRARYHTLKEKMEGGEIHEIDDLITHNLDIQRFAEDALNDYEGSDFIEAFFTAIAGRKALQSNHKNRRGITVLDLACGSGAFLFAALNVLEPLYRRCIERMEEFVAEDDRLREDGAREGPEKHQQFRKVLEEISEHPNERYWIYKTIILNNLYGVDIMREAAEIAKLRLFLKLAAESEYDSSKNNLGLEPLPDIDFNIRAGNSLVGFASMVEFEKFGASQLDLSGDIDRVREDAKLVQMANERFREAQKRGGEDYQQEKKKLAGRLHDLNKRMNQVLANQYSIDHKAKLKEYAQWKQSHQPFHWPAEFYGIMEEEGGFDVVIGNPPYVQNRLVKDYEVRHYETKSCGNLYTMFLERSKEIINKQGMMGMIVPISLSSSPTMAPLRRQILAKFPQTWFSNYAIRPAPLFGGVMQRNTILMAGSNGKNSRIFSTNYSRWRVVEREHLFATIVYGDLTDKQPESGSVIAKVSHPIEMLLLEKLHKHKALGQLPVTNPSQLFYHDSGESYWIKILQEKPVAYRNEVLVEPSDWHFIECEIVDKSFLFSLFNSNLSYWLWTVQTDCRHMTKGFIQSVPVPANRSVNDALIDELRDSYTKNTKLFEKRRGYKSPEITVRNFKAAIDRVDAELAKNYGLTEVELDFIINYDIKYRMGGAQDE